MQIRSCNMDIEVVFSEDGKKTFEIKRAWDITLKKVIVIELYPTVHEENILKSDMSTLHLLNHAQEMGIGEIRILNIYATIYDKKPLAGQLSVDEENLSYIEGILDDEKISEYEIVIAWGSSMAEHIPTKTMKQKILQMLKSRGLEKQVKHIVTVTLDEFQKGTHSLYLGLRHSKEKWKLDAYPLKSVLSELEQGDKKEKDRKENADVLQDKKQTGRKSHGKETVKR